MICGLITSAYMINRSKLERIQMQQLASGKADKVSHVLTELLYKTHILEAFVEQNDGNIDNFDSIASTIVDSQEIRNVLLAPEGKVEYVYPLEGNESVLGLDFFSESAGNKEAILARDTGELVLGGPFDLVQGGQALVGRLPIYIKNHEPEFWGIASVTLNYPEALAQADLKQLKNEGFAFEIWRVSPDTGEEQIIASSGYEYNNRNYVEYPMDILNAKWYFRLSPIRYWYQFPETWIFLISGLVISTLIGFLFLHNYDLNHVRKELEILSLHDSLTGIYNRRGGFMQLEALVKKNKSFALCYLDLNKFKYINDKHGHDSGDKALKIFADIVVKQLDKDQQIFARIGGDEFIIVMKSINDLKDTGVFFEKLDTVLAASIPIFHGEEMKLSYSMGCALFPQDGTSVDELITIADTNMYHAKKLHGCNTSDEQL